jgi:sugar lactone lactonase YvrE
MKPAPPKPPRIALAAAVAWTMVCILPLSGCRLDREGMVLMVDSSYRAAVIGSDKDGFAMPDGILLRRGKLFIADEGGHAVRAWSNANDVETLCDTTLGIHEPEDLAMDDEGNLFFTDDEAGGVWEVDHNGRVFLLAGRSKGLLSTEGIAVAPSGDILVGDGVRHQVFSVSRTGAVSVFLGPRYGITKPESMAFDEKGNLYIADNVDQVIYLLGRDMKLERLIEKRENFSPEGIWYANQVLYVTDSKHGKLSRYTPEEGLKTIAVFGGKLSRVCGITTDDEGHIFVSIQFDLERKRGYIVELAPDPGPEPQVETKAK